jgi:hypothetical protein
MFLGGANQRIQFSAKPLIPFAMTGSIPCRELHGREVLGPHPLSPVAYSGVTQ